MDIPLSESNDLVRKNGEFPDLADQMLVSYFSDDISIKGKN